MHDFLLMRDQTQAFLRTPCVTKVVQYRGKPYLRHNGHKNNLTS